MRILLPTVAAAMLVGTAWAQSAPPSVTIPSGAAHIRNVAVAILESQAVGKIIRLRVVSATPYSVVFAGPQGTGNAMTPSGHAEIEINLAPLAHGTRVTALSYSVAGRGNVATNAAIRNDTTDINRKKLLVPMLEAIKHCSETPVPHGCPNHG